MSRVPSLLRRVKYGTRLCVLKLFLKFILIIEAFIYYQNYTLKGWSSLFRVFHRQIVAKAQIVGLNITSYWFIHTKILHPNEKSKVTDGSSNQKRAYKTDGVIFSKCISSLVFQGTHSWLIWMCSWIVRADQYREFCPIFLNLASESPKNSILTLF